MLGVALPGLQMITPCWLDHAGLKKRLVLALVHQVIGVLSHVPAVTPSLVRLRLASRRTSEHTDPHSVPLN